MTQQPIAVPTDRNKAWGGAGGALSGTILSGAFWEIVGQVAPGFHAGDYEHLLVTGVLSVAGAWLGAYLTKHNLAPQP